MILRRSLSRSSTSAPTPRSAKRRRRKRAQRVIAPEGIRLIRFSQRTPAHTKTCCTRARCHATPITGGSNGVEDGKNPTLLSLVARSVGRCACLPAAGKLWCKQASACGSMSTGTKPVARVLAPSRDAWVEDASNATPSTLLARGSIEIASAEPVSLSLDVSPMSGPFNGGTSLTVVLGGNQPAIGPHQWQLGLAGLTTLHCAPAVELSVGHLRCCCAPEAPANLSRVALTLLRCTRGAAGCAPAAAPASFHYYRDPQIVRATPDRGQVLRTAPHPTALHPPTCHATRCPRAAVTSSRLLRGRCRVATSSRSPREIGRTRASWAPPRRAVASARCMRCRRR